MNPENRITGPWSAIVRGKETGLAGCAAPCPRAPSCLRADPRLTYRSAMPVQDGRCRVFLPAGPTETAT